MVSRKTIATYNSGQFKLMQASNEQVLLYCRWGMSWKLLNSWWSWRDANQHIEFAGLKIDR